VRLFALASLCALPLCFTAPAQATVFEDGFESGDLSRWATAKTDGGDLRASAAAALSGTFGLEAIVDDAKSIYVETASSAGNEYYARFLVRVSASIRRKDGVAGMIALRAAEDKARRLFTILLRRAPDGTVALQGVVFPDVGTPVRTVLRGLDETPHLVEVEWRRASAPNANDGLFRLWVDGEPAGDSSSLPHTAFTAGSVRLGVLNPSGGVSGAIHFDDFRSAGARPPAASLAYAVGGGSFLGAVWGFDIEGSSGALEPLPTPSYAAGLQTSSVASDPSGRFLYASSLVDGTVSAYAVGDGGALTGIAGSPFHVPAAQAVTVHPSGRFIYVTNWSNHTVSGFNLDASGALSAPTPGSPYGGVGAPVSLVASPSGEFLFVANQAFSSISVYSVDPSTGALASVAGSPFPAGPVPLAVEAHPTGRFVYVANNDSDNVSGYAVDPISGALTPVPGSPFDAGPMPRSIAVHPSGELLFVGTATRTFPDPASVVVYRVDSDTGTLVQVGPPVLVGFNNYDLALDSTGKYLYVADAGSSALHGFEVDLETANLTVIPGSPFTVEPRASLFSVVVVP